MPFDREFCFCDLLKYLDGYEYLLTSSFRERNITDMISNVLGDELFNYAFHYGEPRYMSPILERRENKSIRNPTYRFVRCLDDAIRRGFNQFEEQIRRIVSVKYYGKLSFENIEKTGRLYRAKEIIDFFLNDQEICIFDNPGKSELARMWISCLNDRKEYSLCILWILIISIYPKSLKWQKFERLNDYWQYCMGNFAVYGQNTEQIEKNNNPVNTLSLKGLRDFLSLIGNSQLGVTDEDINKIIVERKPFFDSMPGCVFELAKTNNNFKNAVIDAVNSLQDDFYFCLKILLSVSKCDTGHQGVNFIPVPELKIDNVLLVKMQGANIILPDGNSYVLNYGYLLVFDFLQKITDDFTSFEELASIFPSMDFSKLGCFSYDYYSGNWNSILKVFFISDRYRDVLDSKQKEAVLSQIRFPDVMVKDIYIKSTWRVMEK